MIKYNSVRFVFLAALLFNVGIFCRGQQVNYMGTKTPYEQQQKKYAPVPKGYHAIFINHVARHGDRYMTKPGSDSALYQILKLAQIKNEITEQGKKWLQLVEWLIKEQQGRYGIITASGALEHKNIAERMLTLYPTAFKGNGLDVWYTHKVRTLQSAQAFLAALKKYNTSKIKMLTQPDSAEYMLRFYDYSKSYTAFEKSAEVQNRIDTITGNPSLEKVKENVASRFINQHLWEQWTGDKTYISVNGKKQIITPGVFTDALFDTYGTLLSTSEEFKQSGFTKTDLISPFTEQEGRLLGEANNVEDFLVKGPGFDKNGIQVTIAAPLLEHFINTTDSIVNKTKKTDAVLRFTHAEAIAPIAALMEIEQASQPAQKIGDFDKVWRAEKIIPMAATIEWILYTNGKEFLVKMLMNEKESKIPIKTSRFPYYNWKDVKRFYDKKLQEIL